MSATGLEKSDSPAMCKPLPGYQHRLEGLTGGQSEIVTDFADGVTVRSKGVPQGGVISPLLSNLFMRYAFDVWMEREFPSCPWCRYADDGLAHCRSLAEAECLMMAMEERLQECGLQMHPVKTKIVYCKDDDRKGVYPVTSFDFLGYTFRSRRSKKKWGKYFVKFSPAMSSSAGKAIRQEVRSKRSNKTAKSRLTPAVKLGSKRVIGESFLPLSRSQLVHASSGLNSNTLQYIH